MIHLLLIDDNPDDRTFTVRELEREFPDLSVSHIINAASFKQALAEGNFNFVITDYRLRWSNGLAILRQVRGHYPQCPIIMFTDTGTQEVAVEAMKAGLDDYLLKSSKHFVRLPIAVRAVLDRKRAEQAEQQWAQVFEHAEWGMVIGSADGTTLEVANPAFARMHGYTKEELSGRPIKTVFAPECHLQLQQGLEIAHQQGHYTFESKHVRKDGTVFPVLINSTTVRDSTGNTLFTVVNVQDITERKRLEAERDQLLARERAARAEAEAQEKRATFLAAASQMLISSLDYRQVLTSIAHMSVPMLADWCFVDIVENRVVDFTKPVVAAATPEKEDLILQLRRRYPPSPDAPYGPAKVLRTGEPELVSHVSEEIPLALAQNEEHLKLLHQLQATSYMVVPMQVGACKLGTIAFSFARADRRYNQADLEMALELGRRAAVALNHARLYQDAQEANRIKDEFLAIVSHELRTPLNALLGWSQMLRSRKMSEETTAKALATIERNARLQSKLIEDILDISRIVQNRIRLHKTAVHLVPIINEVLEDVRPLAEAKAIDIEPILDPSVGQVFGDPERLQQVVWNLLSNAIKFTAQGGQVKVQLAQTGNDAQITVSDNGQGISADFLPYVFDRFRQGFDTTTRKSGGLGLGLAIVHHLVEMHGGTVYASSAGEGLGATFTVRLPIRELQLIAQPEPEESIVPDQLPRLTGLRVLVVDDDQDTLDLTAFVLKQCQAEVTTANSVDAALTLFPHCQPNLLVSDIGMPGQDGFHLIQQVRQLEANQDKGIPAIALTAFAKEEDQQRAIAAGFQRHLAKPVNPYELVTVVASLVA